MREAKANKRAAYRRARLRDGQDFKPVAFKTLGGWDDEGVILLKRITMILARNQGKEEGDTIRHLVQRVAMAIQKGTANIIIARMPDAVSEQVQDDML